MKLAKLKIQNFRGYKDEIIIEFGNLISFVGKNDIGKSTILEALDIFLMKAKV
jgi:AAA15 family ATPase/GTPase